MAHQHPAPGADSARGRLFDLMDSADPHACPPDRLVALHLAAAQELLDERRRQIRVLDKRAADTGIREIRSLDDIVPLLFSHTIYKSYPLSFLAKGQWDRLLQWFATLSAMPVDAVDLKGVADVDDFLDRLHAAGHFTVTTSGTSGKVSFLDRSQGDNDFLRRCYVAGTTWPERVTADNSRHFYMLGPKSGPYQMMIAARIQCELFARPDSRHFLSNERLRIAYLMRVAEIRRKQADGSATPEEVQHYEAESAAQAARMGAAFEAMADEILDRRREKLLLIGHWGPLWRILQRARVRGIADGEFHPDTIIGTGGGLKGLDLPSDYEAQIKAFFGPVHMKLTYGMSEMSWPFPRCEAGRYHPTPWIIPLVLDDTGESRPDPQGGTVTGRFAMLDLSYQARWGGLITGDQVTMDYGPCPCGRPGPAMAPTIARYSELGGDDKIGCAGTIEAYIRGALAP